uniref:Putative secreted protein n=1 Tax=Xenopsylla cheopis TaxID=163159 RepID=A0A6M2DXC5_XENCH
MNQLKFGLETSLLNCGLKRHLLLQLLLYIQLVLAKTGQNRYKRNGQLTQPKLLLKAGEVLLKIGHKPPPASFCIEYMK